MFIQRFRGFYLILFAVLSLTATAANQPPSATEKAVGTDAQRGQTAAVESAPKKPKKLKTLEKSLRLGASSPSPLPKNDMPAPQPAPVVPLPPPPPPPPPEPPVNAEELAQEQELQKEEVGEERKEFLTTPVTKQDKKWRIGYFQGNDYDSYQKSLIAIVQGLMELGWIETAIIPTPEDPKAARPVWDWLGENLSSQYIEFVADAFYSPEDISQQPEVRQQLLERLNKVGDIDLMLVMGTWAGQSIANNEHSVPSIIGSTTDALAANIIKSVEDSGYDHIHAKIDPKRHENQVFLFKQIIGFQRLGLIYENTPDGRNFGAIESVERVAQHEDFEIVPCYAKNINIDKAQAEKNLIRCFKYLSKKVDALYIARHPIITLQNLPICLEPLFEKHIPTFSQTGADEVKEGVLLSMALSSYRPLGVFYATTMAKIFNGAKPRELPQLFESPPTIAINLATAKAIDYDPPIEILGAADIIYQEIYPPPPAPPSK